MTQGRRKRFGFGGFLIGSGAVMTVLVVILGGLAWKFFQSEFPDVTRLKMEYPRVHYQGKGEDFQIQWHRNRPGGWTRYEEVSQSAVGAIVVSEDWAFYQHKGYDAQQIKEAIKEDLAEGKFARGASTLTQQVIKNVFLTRDKTLWRKLKELYLAIQLEKQVSKRRILETYLNIAEWGEGIFGIRSAARKYFDKSPSELTPKEGAFLAMLLPSPKRYSQSFRQQELTPYARKTINRILQKMTQANYLTNEERELQELTPLSFEKNQLPSLDSFGEFELLDEGLETEQPLGELEDPSEPTLDTEESDVESLTDPVLFDEINKGSE